MKCSDWTEIEMLSTDKFSVLSAVSGHPLPANVLQEDHPPAREIPNPARAQGGLSQP